MSNHDNPKRRPRSRSEYEWSHPNFLRALLLLGLQGTHDCGKYLEVVSNLQGHQYNQSEDKFSDRRLRRAQSASKMPGTINTLLIDGSFEELADELAQYIDDLKKKSGESSSIQSEIAPLLEQQKQQDVLKKLVNGSSALNSAPEKGM